MCRRAAVGRSTTSGGRKELPLALRPSRVTPAARAALPSKSRKRAVKPTPPIDAFKMLQDASGGLVSPGQPRTLNMPGHMRQQLRRVSRFYSHNKRGREDILY